MLSLKSCPRFTLLLNVDKPVCCHYVMKPECYDPLALFNSWEQWSLCWFEWSHYRYSLLALIPSCWLHQRRHSWDEWVKRKELTLILCHIIVQLRVLNCDAPCSCTNLCACMLGYWRVGRNEEMWRRDGRRRGIAASAEGNSDAKNYC